ncbi:UNVERIFIED_CONTAM: hypothetical protein HDU68_012515 [Siphonaria sp. JEL0065]|nr:hypothetical protein HDU68_012515 [Siphonaria sp. JEL0065]
MANSEPPSPQSLGVDDTFFLERIKSPEAASLLSQLKTFLASFKEQFKDRKTSSMGEMRKAISSFLVVIYGASLENPAFADIIDDDELEYIREGWEKLVMMKLHDSVFGNSETKEPQMQRHLDNKITHFNWVVERHFDIPYSFGTDLEAAQAELGKVNGFRCPKDKLTIMMNVLELVVAAIRRKQDSAGNDQLLPVLILVLIRSNTPNIISNVKGKQHVEAGQVQYCLTTMMSAISFIYNMTLASLTLTKEEEADRKTKLPDQFIHLTTPDTPSSITTKQSVARNTRLPGTQSQASAFINNNNATSALSGFASQMFSNTVKVLGDTASVLKATAETVGGTVDGFTQGLIAGFKEDDKQNPTGSDSTFPNSTGTLSSTGSGDSKATIEYNRPSPHAESTPIDIGGKKSAGFGSRPETPQNASPNGTSYMAPGTKAGTAFGKSLIASKQAALKLFTPGSSVLTAQSVFGGRSSETEPPVTIPGGSGTGVGGRSVSRGSVYEELSTSPGHPVGAHFENRLSETEKNMLEDYEMQLALALSLSEAGGGGTSFEGGVPTGLLIDVDPVTVGKIALTAADDDDDDEMPLERKKKSATVE